MTTFSTILAGLISIVVILLRWYITKEKKREREQDEFHKEIATNDLKPLSAWLSDKFDRLRKKVRRRSR